jgi:hypothetical protein
MALTGGVQVPLRHVENRCLTAVLVASAVLLEGIWKEGD